MSLLRGRIVKAAALPATAGGANRLTRATQEVPLARRVPGAVIDAHDEAARIVREAQTCADALLAEARAAATSIREHAAHEAREAELARLAAELLALRIDEEEKAARGIDRTIEIAAALAERLVGEALAFEPARVRALAAKALEETRGARRMRVEASREDLPALEELFASLAEVVSLEGSDELTRGSLVIHTELGHVDARLAPQVERLSAALRETLLRRGTS